MNRGSSSAGHSGHPETRVCSVRLSVANGILYCFGAYLHPSACAGSGLGYVAQLLPQPQVAAAPALAAHTGFWTDWPSAPLLTWLQVGAARNPGA